ncbi:MAG: tryptophan 2,3-dioxygenase family protein [Tunicatimonas sp.]|uniref:tryptophan 2,3-dioxygenase family protein n=1 Tax=Tunicatimonas sp. TaxID=1940096 RepID=UPI003C767087
MKKQDLSPELLDKLEKLSAKYEQNDQNLSDYLDSMINAQYLTYWDYVQLETLLSLQQPKTDIKDEMIFVAYHQITELYFKLILWELDQLTDGSVTKPKVFLNKVQRLNRYFKQLESSFSVMTEGMEYQQFNDFRLALIPSSGFQSVQYRLIELNSTDAINLVDPDHVLWLSSKSTDQEYLDQLYWKAGSRDTKTGKKTLTLQQFEEKYDPMLLATIAKFRNRNLRLQIEPFIQESAPHAQQIIDELRTYDQLANVYWPLAHFRTAVRYLVNGKEEKPATGGTNWRKYLPPRYQRIIFFPELWTDQEKDNWGKSWVLENAPSETENTE